jgi:hypothetical protein
MLGSATVFQLQLANWKLKPKSRGFTQIVAETDATSSSVANF